MTETCNFCGDAIEHASNARRIEFTVCGRTVAAGFLCETCANIAQKEDVFLDMMASIRDEAYSGMWANHCSACNEEEGCEIQSPLNCPKVKKIYAVS